MDSIPDLELDGGSVVQADGLSQKGSYDRIDGQQKEQRPSPSG